MAKHRPQDIRRTLMEHVFVSSDPPTAVIAAKFGITRQAVQRHLASLITERLIITKGRSPHRRYELAALQQMSAEYLLTSSVAEDIVWREVAKPVLADISSDASDICNYGFTEMINNAIDHADARHLKVNVQRTAISLRLGVEDDGVGIFEKIALALNLSDPRQSILELSKGKFTTDPARHTGEGVFFTSRAFDRFIIQTRQAALIRSSVDNDWRVEKGQDTIRGTSVTMELLLPPRNKLEEVFGRFSSGPEEYRFVRTHIPIKLADFDPEGLISRSAAKRVLVRFERFDEVILDFAGVRTIGQGFADEIFRVFAAAHPKVLIQAVNANPQVQSMVHRAQSTSR